MAMTERTGHLAWCALVALALARKNGDVLSPVQENLFLTRWLAAALKQRKSKPCQQTGLCLALLYRRAD